jgi:hypothetical protein
MAAQQQNVINLEDVRAERRAALPVSLEMDWTRLHAEEEEPWAMGKTIWFAVAISTGLWAVIGGIVWFV